MKILIADDDADFARILQRWLVEKGHAVELVFDGAEALDCIKRETFDVIFMDYNMPELTGLELAQYIRKNGIQSKTIVMSGYPAMESQFARKIGADEYIEKPFGIDRVDQLLKKYPPKSGFTAMELLISVGLISALTLGGALAMSPMLRAWRSQDDRLEIQRRLQDGLQPGLRRLRLANAFRQNAGQSATIRFSVIAGPDVGSYILYLYNAADPFGDPYNPLLLYELRLATLTGGIGGTFTYGSGDLMLTNVVAPPTTDLDVSPDKAGGPLAILDITLQKDDDTYRLREKIRRRN